MIVVSNTSPLTNLGAIGRLDLLQRLHGEIHIPRAVMEELRADQKLWPGAKEVAAASWIVQHEVKDRNLVAALGRQLGPGESEALTLAVEFKADLILLDEKDGRAAAVDLGLRLTGVCGVLLRAKLKGEILRVAPELDRLQVFGFYLSKTARRHVLELAGESE